MNKKTTIFGLNDKRLPLWANNILRWMAYETVKVDQINKEVNTQKEIDAMSRWQKFIHGYPRVNHAPSFFMENPFPQPSTDDMEKLEKEYTATYKEWSQGLVG